MLIHHFFCYTSPQKDSLIMKQGPSIILSKSFKLPQPLHLWVFSSLKSTPFSAFPQPSVICIKAEKHTPKMQPSRQNQCFEAKISDAGLCDCSLCNRSDDQKPSFQSTDQNGLEEHEGWHLLQGQEVRMEVV